MMSEKKTTIDRDQSDPSPEEIRKRSAEIRKGWSRRVIERRQAWTETSWRPPLILTLEVIQQLNETKE